MIADSMGTVLPMRSTLERPGVVSMHNAACLISTKSPIQGSAFGCDLVSSQKKRPGGLVSCAKSSEVAVIEKSNGECFLLSTTLTSAIKIQ